MRAEGAGADPTGVLLVNLGTPDAPTPAALRRYLREFLGDPRVVDTNRALWWLLLNGVILPFRAPRSAALYRRVWTEEGSPLLVISRRQADRLAAELGPSYAVALGMRYGNPSLAVALDALAAQGVRRLVLVPLFPQYCESTTGSVVARLEELLADRADAPELVVVPPFHSDAGYLDCVARRVEDASAGLSVDRFVLSFHGIPLRYARRGDPYPRHCEETAEGIARRLDLPPERWNLAYQSRFGREEWLRPYTDELVRGLAPRARRVLVACPGFVADCLETLDEIGEVLARDFRHAGGGELVLAPCPNDGADWVRALARLVRTAAATPAAERE